MSVQFEGHLELDKRARTITESDFTDLCSDIDITCQSRFIFALSNSIKMIRIACSDRVSLGWNATIHNNNNNNNTPVYWKFEAASRWHFGVLYSAEWILKWLGDKKCTGARPYREKSRIGHRSMSRFVDAIYRRAHLALFKLCATFAPRSGNPKSDFHLKSSGGRSEKEAEKAVPPTFSFDVAHRVYLSPVPWFFSPDAAFASAPVIPG